MNEFVEQCRNEWRRLGVADAQIDEMAAELTSDLREAQVAGMSIDEYLGASSADPHGFAAAWAAERGVIPPSVERPSVRRRPIVLVAFTVGTALTLVVAAVLLITGQPTVSVVASRTRHGLGSQDSGPLAPTTRHVLGAANASAPVEWMLLIAAAVALGFVAWLWRDWGRTHTSSRPA